ncbi:LOW QUALITY PROTEIN: retinal pigment epithelial membrane protein-domain-containing protein [Bipolaris maydis]|nr:LOW QUALITY PROTEIN: retinal pigment epithelial membrane protein-domain-containing protein [Bipolaris maydis]
MLGTPESREQINVTLYHVQSDHRFLQIFEYDIHSDGDCSIAAIRIRNGQANYKQSYVRMERFLVETSAGRSLFGRYHNPFTDSELVTSVIRTAANTKIAEMLLTFKEDGPPYAMDPVSMDIIGRYDFEGQIVVPAMAAHSQFDPNTGEMMRFAYEATPFCSMIHDCGITKSYIVLPISPLKYLLDRLRKGGNHWAWDPKEDQWYDIVSLSMGKPEDIVHVTKKYNHVWQAKIDSQKGLSNCMTNCTWDERKEYVYWTGSCVTFQEPSFIMPKSYGAEGKGWLIALLNHLDVLRKNVFTFDALTSQKPPFILQQDSILEWQARRQPSEDVGPVKPATKPRPWQLEAEKTLTCTSS